MGIPEGFNMKPPKGFFYPVESLCILGIDKFKLHKTPG
jgi:hypothetical protein